MYFPLEDHTCAGTAADVIAEKKARINKCFDYTLSTMFGDDWEVQAKEWCFTRKIVVQTDKEGVCIIGELETPYDSLDPAKVNKALAEIRAGRNIAKNRTILLECLKGERK